MAADDPTTGARGIDPHQIMKAKPIYLIALDHAEASSSTLCFTLKSSRILAHLREPRGITVGCQDAETIPGKSHRLPARSRAKIEYRWMISLFPPDECGDLLHQKLARNILDEEPALGESLLLGDRSAGGF